jgi:hypothetical protein
MSLPSHTDNSATEVTFDHKMMSVSSYADDDATEVMLVVALPTNMLT